MGIQDRIKEVEKEIRDMKPDKSNSGGLGRLKAKRAKLRTELFEGKKDAGGHGALNAEGFDVKASGDCLIPRRTRCSGREE